MKLGSVIGQYRVVGKLGSGGMGAVFLAEHALLGRRAAVKALHPDLSIHHEIVERFFDEARATSAISDPGVVQVFDFGYHVDGTAYLVMEYLEGESVQSRIDRLGRIPAAESLRIARQVASSLAAAHAQGIIHRDLKPENLYLVRDGEARSGERTKILDFGVAKLGAQPGGLTMSGTLLGTPAYMSPEQCRGPSTVEARSDVYALGCVLYHMLTGKPPFTGSPVEVVASQLHDPPVPPSEKIGGLTPMVDALVLRCLVKDPDGRYASASELKLAIEDVLHDLDSDSTMPSLLDSIASPPITLDGWADQAPAFLDEPAPPRRRHTGLRVAFAIVVLGGLAAVAVATQLGGSSSTPSYQQLPREPAPVNAAGGLPVAIPADTVAPDAAPVPPDAGVPDAEVPAAVAAEPEPTKVVRPRPRPTRAERPRPIKVTKPDRERPAPEPPPAEDPEDLYDER